MIARVTNYENGDQFVVLCDEHPTKGPCIRYMFFDKASGITGQVRLADFPAEDPDKYRNEEFDDETNDAGALVALRKIFDEIRAQAIQGTDQAALDNMATAINRKIVGADDPDPESKSAP